MSNLKDNLGNNTLTIGSWLSIANPVVCEMMSNAGFDWLVIDMEHTSITSSDMFQMIQIISLSNITPLVRVGSNDSLLIKKAMDCGANGVIVPMTNTKQDAINAVSSVYYPPLGKRGVGLFRAQGYGSEFSKYLDSYQSNTSVIVQIEHYLGVENIDDILSVPGVDGFIVGPYDQTIKTANFPILTNIVGSAFGGTSPFQAEIYFMNLSIKTLSVFLKELAIEWSDGSHFCVPLKKIRLFCPCAGCGGEKDVLGNVYKNLKIKHSHLSYELLKYEEVGLYGIRFFWKDGHHDGIYTFQLLKSFSSE